VQSHLEAKFSTALINDEALLESANLVLNVLSTTILHSNQTCFKTFSSNDDLVHSLYATSDFIKVVASKGMEISSEIFLPVFFRKLEKKERKLWL